MANSFSQSFMTTWWDELLQSTDMDATLSKTLPKWDFGDLEGERSNGKDIAGNQADTVWIPQDVRFIAQDGYVSTNGDFQDIIERNVPVRRNKAHRILFKISTKALRDPMHRQKAIEGARREIRNKIDMVAYQTIINNASMTIKSTAAFDWTLGVDAENLMINNGLAAYNSKLWLSNKDYAAVAKELGKNQYYGRDGVPLSAFEKTKIPNIANFDTYSSNYLLNLTGNAAAGVTVNGNQSHTVATYTSADQDQYLDNRSMVLNVNTGFGASAIGTKFTIAGVYAVNPETRTVSSDLRTFTIIGGSSTAPVIQPAIVVSGPYQNCSVQAADAAAITVLSKTTAAPSVFWADDSVYLVPGRLPVTPAAGVEVMEGVTEQGLPMRMTYQYDFHNEELLCKAVIYFDVAATCPDMIGAILTNQAA